MRIKKAEKYRKHNMSKRPFPYLVRDLLYVNGRDKQGNRYTETQQDTDRQTKQTA